MVLCSSCTSIAKLPSNSWRGKTLNMRIRERLFGRCVDHASALRSATLIGLAGKHAPGSCSGFSLRAGAAMGVADRRF
jgi:hypothetical protein